MAVAGIAIHQVYVFLFFSVILCMLFYEVIDNKWKKSYIAWSMVVVLTACATFIFFQFYASSNITMEELRAIIETKSNIPFKESVFQFEYFYEMKDHMQILMIPNYGQLLRDGCLTLMLLVPVILVYIYIWQHSVRKASGAYRVQLLLIALLIATCIPSFVMTYDWWRWISAVSISQFLIILILLHIKNEFIMDAVEQVSLFFKKRKWLFLLMVLFLASIEKLDASDAPVQVKQIVELFTN